MKIVEQRPVIRSTTRPQTIARAVPADYWDDLEERNEIRAFLLMATSGILIPLLLTIFVFSRIS